MKLYLIGGVPGSGKSTLAKRMIDNNQADCHFEADMYFSRTGEYLFDPTSLSDAHEWCMTQTRAALKAGKNVVVSNTFTRKWERDIYELAAEETGAEYDFIKVDGNYKNVHGVPDWKVKQMRDRWED
jgi:predicted kinase